MLLEKNNQLYFLLNTAKQYCSSSFQVVSRYFEIGWGRTGGWWDNICGRDFWEMPTERNAGAGDEMPDGTFLQAWPFIFWLALRALRTAVPDERCFQSWNPDKKTGDREMERLWKIKMSTKLRAARKVAINHKALKPNNQKHSICLASLLFRRKSWPGRKILLHNFDPMVKRGDDFVATKFDGHWPAHVLSSSSRKTGILTPLLNYYVIDVWCIKMFLRCLASSWSSGIVIRWLRQRPRN